MSLSVVEFRNFIKHQYGNRDWAACVCAVENVSVEDTVSMPTPPSEAPGDDLLPVFRPFIIHQESGKIQRGLLLEGTT